jgi:hypothetical protein
MGYHLPTQAARPLPGRVAAAILLAAGAPIALAQAPRPIFTPGNPAGPVSYAGRWARATRVQLPPLRTLYVTRHGAAGGPLPGSVADGCDQVSTHTDADFEGGTFNLEAGFAETEVLAASYVLTAADFPLRLNTAETIFATSNTTQTTTTEWSVLVWQGLPSTGALVAEESSDGSIIPHVVLPPGTGGTHLVFQVDPGDPDQIIIQDDGTHTFSIGFRIDHHNHQTQNPCSGIPVDSNAFPVTDTSGVSSLAGNWLRAVNCGALGCPPGGGWASFSQLSQLCRPTGDWVLLATWAPVSCAASGACCIPGGNCQVLTQAVCTSQGGVYSGDNSDCTAASCTGACCFGGSCLNFTSADCATAGGSFQGIGTACIGGACPSGACCFADGTCATLTSAVCTAQGGTFRGANTSCATANCPQPPGACCLAGGGCLNLTQADCAVIPGVWRGAGTLCASGICAQPVCYPNCDQSTAEPVLNVLDFNCFLNRFTSGDSYANCDGSSQAPVLNVLDFNCFLNRFTSGCP